MNSSIGGAFIWYNKINLNFGVYFKSFSCFRDTSLDDFTGDFCCQGKFPLIRTVGNVFIGNLSYNTNLCCGSESTIKSSTPKSSTMKLTTKSKLSTLSISNTTKLKIDGKFLL